MDICLFEMLNVMTFVPFGFRWEELGILQKGTWKNCHESRICISPILDDMMKIRDGSFFQKELPVIIYNVYLERSTIVSHISRIDNGFLHQVALRKFLRIDVAVDMFTSMHRCHCGYVSMIESDVW